MSSSPRHRLHPRPSFPYGRSTPLRPSSSPPSHDPIEILRIGIGLGSALGGQPQQVEQAIHVYEGALSDPGSPTFSVSGGSQGNICATGNAGRYAANVLNSGGAGTFGLAIDLTSMPTVPTQRVFPGQSWYFQAWFRDANPQVTSNSTDGLCIPFQ